MMFESPAISTTRYLISRLKDKKTLRRFITALLLICCVVGVTYFAQPTSALNRTWDGGGATQNWSDAANWSGDVIPGSGDIAVFDGTSTKNAIIDPAFAGSIAGIQINAGTQERLLRHKTLAQL